MCFLWHAKHKASLLTAKRKLKTSPPPFPPVWLHIYLPNGGCALTFAGINILVYLDFPSLICLNEINSPSCGQIYPKLELSLMGSPANRTHPKQDSTNSNNRLNNTILGTWSINHCKYGEECKRPRYTGINFIRGLSRSVSPRGTNKQQLEIV